MLKLSHTRSPQLVIGTGDNRSVRVSSIAISEGVAERFKDIASDTFSFVNNGNKVDWSIEAEIDNESFLVLDDLNTLGDTPRVDREPLMCCLQTGFSRFQTSEVKDIKFSRVFFYAVYLELDGGDDCILIKKSNPTKYMKKGRFYTFAGDELEMVEQNILSFENDFDFMLVRGELYVFSQAAFSMMFRGQKDLSERSNKWVTDLSNQIDIDPDTVKNLKKKVESNSFSARKIESILSRGHLIRKNVNDLQPLMSEHGLDYSDFIHNGKIKCDMDKVSELLGFLNEDLFTGSISSTNFIASRKTLH